MLLYVRFMVRAGGSVAADASCATAAMTDDAGPLQHVLEITGGATCHDRQQLSEEQPAHDECTINYVLFEVQSSPVVCAEDV